MKRNRTTKFLLLLLSLCLLAGCGTSTREIDLQAVAAAAQETSEPTEDPRPFLDDFIALLITYVVAETAHVRNLSPYVLMGAAACLARVCLAAALLGGHAIGSLPGGLFGESEHIMRYLVVIMAVIYALSLAAVLVSRDRRRRRRGDADAGSTAAAAAPAGAAEAAPLPAGAVAEGDDAFAVRCAAVAAAGGLTEREAEIMRYLARGRTKAHIAGVLFVSENTVRSHVRNIYAKLEVHTRQQLIDLVEEERGADGGGEAPGCR